MNLCEFYSDKLYFCLFVCFIIDLSDFPTLVLKNLLLAVWIYVMHYKMFCRWGWRPASSWMHGLKGEMNLLRSCRTKMSVCRLCLLLSLLCVCAHVYMQLEGLHLRKQSQHHRTVATATDAAADAGSTCCSALKHHRQVSESLSSSVHQILRSHR